MVALRGAGSAIASVDIARVGAGPAGRMRRTRKGCGVTPRPPWRVWALPVRGRGQQGACAERGGGVRSDAAAAMSREGSPFGDGAGAAWGPQGGKALSSAQPPPPPLFWRRHRSGAIGGAPPTLGLPPNTSSEVGAVPAPPARPQRPLRGLRVPPPRPTAPPAPRRPRGGGRSCCRRWGSAWLPWSGGGDRDRPGATPLLGGKGALLGAASPRPRSSSRTECGALHGSVTPEIKTLETKTATCKTQPSLLLWLQAALASRLCITKHLCWGWMGTGSHRCDECWPFASPQPSTGLWCS
ncbi:uncharacterized protein LOC141918786 [Strix aluco]